MISVVGCESAFITETKVIYETWLGAGLRYSNYEKETTNKGNNRHYDCLLSENEVINLLAE